MTHEGFKRKLAAILSADVVGYSRLMRADEDSTIRTLSRYRSAISNLIQKFRGHVVDATGDNLLAEFTSVVDAVNSAVEIQRNLAERNAELPDERKMDFRIGVNLGDVVKEGGCLYGDGVNIAARMEGLAVAGGVCISGSVHDSVESKLGLEYEEIFAIQDEITLKILCEIKVKLTGGEKIHSYMKYTNLQALEKAMEATTYLRSFNIESNATARRLAEETIALDPKHTAGYNILAAVNIMDVYLSSSKSIKESISKATELLQKDIDLDENYDPAYSLLGHIYAMQGQFDKAITMGEKAIELNPNSDEAYIWLAMALNFVGKPEKSIEMSKKAIRLCPFPPSYYYLNLGNAYNSAGRFEEAISEYKKALHLTTQNIMIFRGLAVGYGLLGLEEKSKAAAAEVIKLNPNFNIKVYMKIMSIYKNQELAKRWADALRKAGIPEG